MRSDLVRTLMLPIIMIAAIAVGTSFREIRTEVKAAGVQQTPTPSPTVSPTPCPSPEEPEKPPCPSPSPMPSPTLMP